MEKIIEVQIAKGYYNCEITFCNYFVCDTNDSSNRQTMKLPLPIPPYNKWEILSYNNIQKEHNIIELISKTNFN